MIISPIASVSGPGFVHGHTDAFSFQGVDSARQLHTRLKEIVLKTEMLNRSNASCQAANIPEQSPEVKARSAKP